MCAAQQVTSDNVIFHNSRREDYRMNNSQNTNGYNARGNTHRDGPGASGDLQDEDYVVPYLNCPWDHTNAFTSMRSGEIVVPYFETCDPNAAQLNTPFITDESGTAYPLVPLIRDAEYVAPPETTGVQEAPTQNDDTEPTQKDYTEQPTQAESRQKADDTSAN